MFKIVLRKQDATRFRVNTSCHVREKQILSGDIEYRGLKKNIFIPI